MVQHPSSSSSSPRWCYDVFLSFRGEDTREGFTSHLYHALCRAGIFTFMDVQLKKGEEVSSELSLKIEQSRFSIVVFSENYTSSRWCLNELEKITEWKEKMGHQVIPVFYKVEPTEIRKQNGKTGEHLEKFHEEFGKDSEKVKRWRTALTDCANLSGWPFKGRTETEMKLIQNIVKDVSRRLNRMSLSIAHYPVGIEDCIKRIDSYLGIGLDNEVRMIGIFGDELIGKSTIARAIVNYHGHRFDGSSFLEGVKAAGTYGLVKFQQTLLFEILGDDSIQLGNSHTGASVIRRRLCSKKVLVVIDDVDDLDHLRLLAGSIEWFGSGSRIIITTQDRDLLQAHGVEHLYKMVGLDEFHATQLFYWNAFRKLNPPEMFVELSQCIVKFVQGIPGALICIGSHLYGKSAEEWEVIITVLQEAANNEEVRDEVCKITIDGLSQIARAIFLVIAYVLNGKDKEDVKEILDVSASLFDAGIEDLTSKSLIRIQQNKVWVSDSLRELASKILHAKSQIKFRLMRILNYLDDATCELGNDSESAARALYDEIFNDSDDEEEEGLDDVIDELTNWTESVALDKVGVGEEVLGEIAYGAEVVVNVGGKVVEEIAEGIESLLDGAISFFS